MADLKAIRDALVTSLASLNTLNVFDTHPDAVPVPAAVVMPPRIVPHGTLTSAWTYEFVVRLYVNRASVRTAQDELDDYLARSDGVVSLFESDPTLGGAVSTIRCTSVESASVYEVGDVPLLGVEINLEVIA